MSAFADCTTLTSETDPVFNLRRTIKFRLMETENTHNPSLNNTATRNIHGGLNSIFSGNIFGGTFNVV